MKWLKVEWIFRAVTVLAFIALSFGFSTWLPDKFCSNFKNAFTKMGLSTAKLNSCKWQVFGIRLLLLVLYLPVEFLLLIVVKRYTSDSTFNIRLKEALAKGEDELIAFIEEQRI